MTGLHWKQPAWFWKKQLLCVMAGLLLGVLGELNDHMNSPLKDGQLERPGYGQDEVTRELLVEGLGSEKVPLTVTVSGRIYGEQERQKQYEQIMDQLPEQILGDNPSLSQVQKDLNLITWIEPEGIRLSWQSDNSQVLEASGVVHVEEVSQEGEEVWLEVELTDGNFPEMFRFPVKVFPAEQTEAEKELKSFEDALRKEDKLQQETPWMRLPGEYGGKALSYQEKKESSLGMLTALGIVGAVLLTIRDYSQKEQQRKNRESQLLLDYPELVSKMMIFLGAGLTIRKAWERIGTDYQKAVQLHGSGQRFVYEEVCEACRQMDRGVPEGQAYREFSRRIGLRPYMKLCSLLEQNRKNGSRNVRELLRAEMSDAFETRKQAAKRLGEEAGTRLLIPLFLMLAVVMVMIAVPALLEFL